jgi:hypothetical protein
LLPDSPNFEALAEPRRIDPQGEGSAPVSAPAAPDIDALKDFDRSNPDQLRPTLAALIKAGADRFDPVRIRLIQALAEKALHQRPSVAPMLEAKALQLLSDYLNAYFRAREQAASLVTRVTAEVPEAADEIRSLFERGDFRAVARLAAKTASHENDKAGALAVLTREMLQRSAHDQLTAKPSLEDKLRQQELAVMQSVGSTMGGGANGTEHDQQPDGSAELNAMRNFRQSLRKRHSERRVTRAIQQGPENPGPLNVQALIIRSLSLMRNLSPSYTDRFVSYLDTLLWLERAGATAKPAKPKGRGRRKS